MAILGLISGQLRLETRQVSASTNPVTLTTVSSGDFDGVGDNQKRVANRNDADNDGDKRRNVVVKSVVRNDEKRLTEKIYSGILSCFSFIKLKIP